MDRRELLKMIALATGGAVIGGEFFLAGCKNKEAGSGMAFSSEDIAFLDEVAETILPKTQTPGAKEAEVGKFMTVMVNDCYEEKDQKKFEQKYQLPFPLLADADHKITDAYGVWGMKKLFGREFRGILRTTFIIDEKGVIQKIFLKPKNKAHAEEIIAFV